MITLSKVRVPARALVRVTACGSAVVIGLATAYTCGNAIQRSMLQMRAHDLADAAAHGFSESALRLRQDSMSPGVVAIAQRHDPYVSDDNRSRLADQFAADLDKRGADKAGKAPSDGLRLRTTLAMFSPAAQPFRGSSALASARETECLTQAVYYEARGETPAGQAAVAQVVLNRVRNPSFPKSVCGVVFQGAQAGACQFSFVCDGSLHRTRETGAWRRAQTVASRALSGFVMADVGNATHFHAARIGPQWGGMVRVAQVGLHVFYRFGGRSGAPDSFRRTYRPDSQPQAIYASLTPDAETPHYTILGGTKPADAAQPETAIAKPLDVKPSSPSKPPAAKPPTSDVVAEPVSASAPAKTAQAGVTAS